MDYAIDQITKELPGRGLHLLLMGAAAHEVECESHVALHERHEGPNAPTSPRDVSFADLDRLFRGA